MPHELVPDRYLQGIELFNRGEYFDAHEVWEDPWRDAGGAQRTFYQGLIQAAVALEHCRRGNVRGAANVWRNSRAKLTSLPARFMGMNLQTFVEDMGKALGPALAAAGGGERERADAPFDPSAAPRVHIDINAA